MLVLSIIANAFDNVLHKKKQIFENNLSRRNQKHLLDKFPRISPYKYRVQATTGYPLDVAQRSNRPHIRLRKILPTSLHLYTVLCMCLVTMPNCCSGQRLYWTNMLSPNCVHYKRCREHINMPTTIVSRQVCAEIQFFPAEECSLAKIH